MLVIIDCGMGNTGSIVNMLKEIGVEACLSAKYEEIKQADKLILPGVGAFDKAITNLQNLSIVSLLEQKVMEQKTPILGICLGLQLFTKRSEEGKLPGLGWVDAEVKKFQFETSQSNLKIPHMGWNQIKIKKESLLLKDLEENSRFYFAHSYHLVCNNPEDELTGTMHGYCFSSSIQNNNILGVQFHPEKSHKFGLQLLTNFVRYF